MDKTLEFYQTFFMMEVVKRAEIPKNNAEIAFLKDSENGDFALEVTHYKDQETFEQSEYEKRVFDHLAFVVPDLKGLVEKIRDAGHTVTDEPFELSPGHWLAFVEDPDGVLIELIAEG